METLETFRDVIRLWPSHGALAGDITPHLQATASLTAKTVGKWAERDSISGTYWLPIVRAAAERGFPGVTLDLLAKIAASKLSGAA